MSINPHTTAIDTINGLNAYQLARMVDLTEPDTLGSPGAAFLGHVRESFVEWVEYVRDDYDVLSIPTKVQDEAFEQVDAIVPVLTNTVWKTFVDLCAYNDESVEEFDGGTMTERATYILARIAERLFVALAEDYASAHEDVA